MRSAIDKVADRKVAMTVDGKRTIVPVTEALMMQLMKQALAGDAPSRRDFFKIVDQASQARAQQENKAGVTTVVIRRFTEPKGFSGALEALGVVAQVGESGELKIQPWVVEAAMTRGPKLSEVDKALVGNSTIKPDDEVSQRTITEPKAPAD